MTTIYGDTPQPRLPIEAWRGAYHEKLNEATRVLTEAARLARPRLQRTDDDGGWVDDPMGATEQGDWPEFVTLALAGAAANYGGVDAILAGRSGSWEAEGVRQLLHSTVGPDEDALWEHRTEPVDITLYVDELLAERTDVNREYDAATQEVQRRFEAAEAADPPIEYSHYVWEYERSGDGRWVPRLPEAPPWSLEAWRASLAADGVDADTMASLEASLLETASGVHIPKSAEDLDELRPLEAERDARLDPITYLDEQLEQQRLSEWTTYGEALKARVEAAAAATAGLSVPVTVRVDVTTFRSPGTHQVDDVSLESRLVDAAVMDAPTPEDVPGSPLDRLTVALNATHATNQPPPQADSAEGSRDDQEL